jgi:transposase
MMGRLSGAQVQLFYAFRLEDRVPSSHLLRQIDAVLDLGDLRRLLAPFYSHTGRPSVDPELMMRMLIVGYCFGIRSERRLCEDVSLNLAYRWFCRLGLEDQVPDHSTFGKNRHGRFRDSNLFRYVFETGRDHARSLADTQEFEDSSRRRKKIEMLFAHLKRQLGFERLRLRGPSGARDEFLLAATAQNLKRLARLTNQLGCFA